MLLFVERLDAVARSFVLPELFRVFCVGEPGLGIPSVRALQNIHYIVEHIVSLRIRDDNSKEETAPSSTASEITSKA